MILIKPDILSGKTSLFRRFTSHQYLDTSKMSVTQSRQSTLGLDHFSKKFTHDNKTIKIQLWYVFNSNPFIHPNFDVKIVCNLGIREALNELPASPTVITSLPRLVSHLSFFVGRLTNCDNLFQLFSSFPFLPSIRSTVCHSI